ncbi:MAG: anti-sigma factor [Acidobacteriota bacterium]
MLPEDEALERALEMLERAVDPQTASDHPRDDAVRRELAATLDTLAELAYGTLADNTLADDTEPVAPSAGAREALLHAAAHTPQATAPVVPFVRSPAETTLHRAGEAPSVDGASSRPTATPAPRPWVSWAVAAVLLGCMLGLGYLAGTLGAARDTIERQTRELATVRDTVDSMRLDMASAQRDLELTRERLDMVTLTARQAYPMNAQRVVDTTGATRADDAKGIVYVCGQHQQWLLSLTGLKQPPEGEIYRLWFMTTDGPIDGGILEVDENGDAAAEDLSMPHGTRGFSVSLEPAGEPPTVPHELILRGDEPVRL